MGMVQFNTVELSNDTITTTTETVVATLSGITTGRKKDVNLKGWFQLTTGTNTTAVTARIRRGTDITGTLVGEANPVTVGAAAGSTEQFDIAGIDAGVDLSGGTYVLTCQQTGASANGSALAAQLEATVID